MHRHCIFATYDKLSFFEILYFLKEYISLLCVYVCVCVVTRIMCSKEENAKDWNLTRKCVCVCVGVFIVEGKCWCSCLIMLSHAQ